MSLVKGTVLIVGLGLIGGSLSLCIKQSHPEANIIGYDTNEKETRLASAMGVIDEGSLSFQSSAECADLIILATPVFQTKKLLQELSQFTLKNGVIITDTGSTKASIMESAQELLEKGIIFIGGHPMAGSHKSGVAAAKTLLFENAFYLLTPSKETSRQALIELQYWLEGTRAKFLEVDALEHDELTGAISHFPHIVAASLVHQVKFASETSPHLKRLAAGGFRDITRIASSSPIMWKDISLQNKNVLLHILEKWKVEMERVMDMIQQEDAEKVEAYFADAKQFRDELPVKAKGAIPSFYDLYVDIPDYPGIISEVTGYLAEERISLTNIRIMETREDIYGVLVISFQTSKDRERARICLSNKTSYELFLT
jgi:prephenate dehydrogenase